jgi:hypothetical protein
MAAQCAASPGAGLAAAPAALAAMLCNRCLTWGAAGWGWAAPGWAALGWAALGWAALGCVHHVAHAVGSTRLPAAWPRGQACRGELGPGTAQCTSNGSTAAAAYLGDGGGRDGGAGELGGAGALGGAGEGVPGGGVPGGPGGGASGSAGTVAGVSPQCHTGLLVWVHCAAAQQRTSQAASRTRYPRAAARWGASVARSARMSAASIHLDSCCGARLMRRACSGRGSGGRWMSPPERERG